MENSDALYSWLLQDTRFVAWVTGDVTGDEAYWHQWAAGNPARLEAMAEARATILTIQDGQSAHLSEEYILNQIRRALDEASRREAAATQQRGRFGLLRWAATSVLVLIGIGTYLTISRTDLRLSQRKLAQSYPDTSFSLVLNESQPARYVQLPDGSSVILGKKSRLRYPKRFAVNRREVLISGEAFFEIAKNAEKPFFVYANEVVTKVLGTSFSVKAVREDPRVTVVVKTGRVAVFMQNDQSAEKLLNNRALSGQVLTPNQQVVFERSKTKWTTSWVKKPGLIDLPIESQPFVYEATPVATVFTALEKAYGIPIVFDAQLMAHCSLTATLGDEPLLKKLTWICAMLDASYEVTDAQITITGNPVNH